MARVRLNQKKLTSSQWTAFIKAVKGLKAQTNHPNYDDFALAHTMARQMMQAHERYTFLPWHREFLFHFENALLTIDSTVTVPYWNWTEDREIPDALADAAEWDVTRAMKKGDKISPKRKDDVALAMSKTTFVAFHDRINGPHGAVHLQIGGFDEQTSTPLGEMADIEKSPRDVLFWLHHAFLDKLWADWSDVHPGKVPPDGIAPVSNVNARLLPTDLLTHTSRQVFAIVDLGYNYE